MATPGAEAARTRGLAEREGEPVEALEPVALLEPAEVLEALEPMALLEPAAVLESVEPVVALEPAWAAPRDPPTAAA